VLVALTAAGKKSIDRWRAETATLQSEVRALVERSEDQADPVARKDFVEQAETRFQQIPSLTNLNWFGLLGAGFLYGVALLPPCWILNRTLRAMDLPCSLSRSVAAQLLGHTGKYIPGKAMVVVLRVGAILPNEESRRTKDPGETQTSHRIAKATTSVFFETLLMMGTGGLIAGVLLFNSPLPTWVRLMAILMSIGSAIPVCPPVMRWMLSRLQKNKSPESKSSPQRSSITWRLLAECSLASALSWLFIGGSFAMLITAIPSFEPVPTGLTLLPVSTASISLGMVLGFASLLPGGAGVREYVTLLVLTPVIGPVHSLLAVIAARLMFILVETILAGFAWLYLQQTPLAG
jgi:uncharacterized membrane protein YbhN (UPF0104 family)